MANFTTQITDYLADAVASGDIGVTEAMLDLWMQEGAKHVINRMPKTKWHHFSFFAKTDSEADVDETLSSSDTTITTTDGTKFTAKDYILIDNEIMFVDGLADDDIKVIRAQAGTVASTHADGSDIYLVDKKTAYACERPVRVLRESGTQNTFYPCREIPPMMSTDYASIAATDDPVFYHENGLVITIPKQEAAPQCAIIVEVVNPTIDASGDSSIDNFPSDLYQAVVKYATVQCKIRELALMRRNSQDEVEAAVTLLGTVATAVSNASTEIAKVDDTIDEGSTEFDKISALLDKGETDSEGDVNTALSALTTAAGRINTAVGFANTEFDLVNPEVDDADTILDDDEDINRTGSQLSIAQVRISNGKAYLDEAMSAVNEANSYAQEVASRLQQATAKRSEGGSRSQSGGTFLAEAQARIANGQALLAEAAGSLSQTQVRLSDATTWLNMGNQSISDYKILQQEIEIDINNFIAK